MKAPSLPPTLHIQRRQLKLLFPISSPHSTNERLRAGARSTFFLQWPFPFIVSDTNCIRVYILVFCVTLYRGFGCSRGRPAGKSVSQSGVGRAGQSTAGRAEGRPGQSAGWLTLSPCSSFEPCQRVRFLSASECLTTSQRYATFQAGKITNLELIKKPYSSDVARFGLNFGIFWCVVFVVRKSYSHFSIICSNNNREL